MSRPDWEITPTRLGEMMTDQHDRIFKIFMQRAKTESQIELVLEVIKHVAKHGAV